MNWPHQFVESSNVKFHATKNQNNKGIEKARICPLESMPGITGTLPSNYKHTEKYLNKEWSSKGDHWGDSDDSMIDLKPILKKTLYSIII